MYLYKYKDKLWLLIKYIVCNYKNITINIIRRKILYKYF